MAVELTVNPNTIAKAYQDLEREGVIESSRGRGTFVAASKPVASERERLARLGPVIDRLIAEAYPLGVSDEDLSRLLTEGLEERRRDRRDK